MLRYFVRKLGVYGLTFVVAVTVDWAIPHLMPGNPVLTLVSRIHVQDPKVAQHLYDTYMRAFNLDLPLWKQYGYFWISLFHGDLGTSILQFPTPVSSIIVNAAPYTLGLLLPAILLSSLGMGAVFMPLTLVATTGLEDEDQGLASGLFNTSQQIGGALGLAIFSAIATSRTNDLLAAGRPLPDAMTQGFHRALLAASAFLLAAAFVALRTRNTRGEHAKEALTAAAAMSEMS